MEKLIFIKPTECKLINIPFNPFDWIEIDSPEPALIEIAEQFDLKIISYRSDNFEPWNLGTLLVDFVGTLENCQKLVDFFDFAKILDCTFVHNNHTQTLEVIAK